MKKIVILIIMLIVMFSTASACWGWFIYHKPEYRGRIIDAETKAPIEGAVVVVVYYKERIIGNVGGSVIRTLDARETLTDNKGEFYFPSYAASTPFWREHFAQFIIYKPGYLGSWPILPSYTMAEKFFSIDVIGTEGEIRDGQSSWKGVLGVLESTRAKTREERLRAIPSPPSDYTSKELPLFIKIINEEGNNLGLKGGYK